MAQQENIQTWQPGKKNLVKVMAWITKWNNDSRGSKNDPQLTKTPGSRPINSEYTKRIMIPEGRRKCWEIFQILTTPGKKKTKQLL